MNSYFKDMAEELQAKGRKIYPVSRPPKGIVDGVFCEYIAKSADGLLVQVQALVGQVEWLLALCHEYGIDFDALWDEKTRARKERRKPNYGMVLRLLGADVKEGPKLTVCDWCQRRVEAIKPVGGKSICVQCLREMAAAQKEVDA